MIQVQNIAKSYGLQELFSQAGFQMGAGDRLGVSGRNGSGKSTLFRILLGQESADAGQINIPRGYTLGHLEQHLHFTHSTVREEAVSSLKPHEDGWTEDHKVESILFGLGFDEASMERSPLLLSGGFQIRLNLAKVLASEPSLLLLDEPTNYLDIVSVRWLERFLRNWKGELLLITHDRSFMDRVCTHTLGIHRGRFRKVEGTVDKLHEVLLAEEEVMLRTQENEARKREQLEKFIDRFRAQATKAKAVQSRVKALERHEPVQKLSQIRNLDFCFAEAPFPGKRMLQIQDLGFHYTDGPWLLENLQLEVFAGDRIAIIGPNGRGKSTLLNLIAKELLPINGSVQYNPNLQINYFGQTNINRLDLTKTVEEEIQTAVVDHSRGRARSLAGVMMFEGDAALKSIKVLSGGERSRVLLAKILARPCNLLLLDEPTNHLDMESIDSLIEALGEFDGSLMMVTHDEGLLRSLATRLVVFDGGRCFTFEGGYQDFLDRVGWAEERAMAPSAVAVGRSEAATPEAVSRAPQDRKARAEWVAERARVLKPLEQKVQQLEKEIAQTEAKVKTLEAELVAASSANEGTRIAKLAKELAQAKDFVESAYSQWESTHLEWEKAKEQFA